MTLKQVTIRLAPGAAMAFGSPDGTLTFDLPEKAYHALAEQGLRSLASRALSSTAFQETDPLDTLWEKLDALSKD